MSPRANCSATSTRITPCTGLSECLEDGSNPQRMRLVLDDIIKWHPSARRIGQIVTLRSGKHRKSGIIFNHCPFCGQPLDFARSRVGKKGAPDEAE